MIRFVAVGFGAARRASFPDVRRLFSGSPKETGGGAWGAYMRSLEKRPILTKAVTSGVLTFTADIICQLKFPSTTVQEGIRAAAVDEGVAEGQEMTVAQEIRMRLAQLDHKRLGIFTLLGVVYIAPCLHFWYGFLMRAVTGVTLRATLTRVFFDQTMFAPLFLGGLFSGGLLLEGRPEAVATKLQKDLPITVLMNWSVWVPSMLIMFRFVPAPLQVRDTVSLCVYGCVFSPCPLMCVCDFVSFNVPLPFLLSLSLILISAPAGALQQQLGFLLEHLPHMGYEQGASACRDSC